MHFKEISDRLALHVCTGLIMYNCPIYPPNSDGIIFILALIILKTTISVDVPYCNTDSESLFFYSTAAR